MMYTARLTVMYSLVGTEEKQENNAEVISQDETWSWSLHVSEW